jgi:hypothetical protein
MISIKRLFHKILFSLPVTLPLAIVLIIVRNIVYHKPIDDSAIESLTSFVRAVLLSDIQLLPARQMSSYEVPSENLSNRLLSYPSTNTTYQLKDPKHRLPVTAQGCHRLCGTEIGKHKVDR